MHTGRCARASTHARAGGLRTRGRAEALGRVPPAPRRQGTGDVVVLTSPPLNHRPYRARGCASPGPRSTHESSFPSCAKNPKQLLAAVEASPPRGPSRGDPTFHVSSHSSPPLRPPAPRAGCCRGARWELPSASSPQAVPGTWLPLPHAGRGRGALWGDPQLQPCCKGLGEMLRLRAGTGLSRTGGASRAGGWRGEETSCVPQAKRGAGALGSGRFGERAGLGMHPPGDGSYPALVCTVGWGLLQPVEVGRPFPARMHNIYRHTHIENPPTLTRVYT